MRNINIICLSWIVFLLIISSFEVGFSLGNNYGASLNVDKISFEFNFEEPAIQTNEEYDTIVHSIHMNDLPLTNDFNKPMLPVKPIKVLLPYGKTVKEISVEIDQPSITYKDINPKKGPILAPLGMNIYTMDSAIKENEVPLEIWSYHGIHYYCGFPILLLNDL